MKSKGDQIIKSQHTFFNFRGGTVPMSMSPVVVLKKIRLGRADGSDRTSALPELEDGDEILDVDMAQDTPNREEESKFEVNELSFIHTMTKDEVNAHIRKCLEMSTENKITPKNAFALQLIDCMNFLVDKKDDFSTMACTLDAGAKIYSYRVDALHQQVTRLAEEMTQRQREKKKATGEETETDEIERKEKRKANKRNVIATADGLVRKMKGKDPRDKFVKVDALPGSIMLKVRRDPKDLSFTLENNIPFWINWEEYQPMRGKGMVELPYFKIFRDKNEKVERTEFMETCVQPIDATTTVNEDDIDPEVSQDDSVFDAPVNEPDYDGLLVDMEDENKKPEEEVGVITTAMKRLNEEAKLTGETCSSPSRLEVMKMIFSEASDYNYLDMKNAHYWAGPDFWKRPNGRTQIGKDKTKAQRKKKEPCEISYDTDGVNGKWEKLLKRGTILAKRTVSNWKKSKLTLPTDLKIEVNLFFNLFNIERGDESGEKVQQEATEFVNSSMHQEANTSESVSDGNSQEQLEQSSSQEDMNACFYEGVPGTSGSGDALNSAFYDVGVTGRSECGRVIKVEMESRDSCMFGEATMVPAPKLVTFQPIQYSSRPIRVDMRHLKETMMDVLRSQLREGTETRFSRVLKDLPGLLEGRTAADVSPAIAFQALLTLANEHGLRLQDSDNYTDVIIQFGESIG